MEKWNPQDIKQWPIDNFSPGLITALADTLITPGSCSDCLNVHFDDGFINKRDGYAKYRTDGLGGKVETIYEYRKSTTQSWVIAATASTVYAANDTGWTTIASGLTGGKPRFTTFAGALLMLNGEGFLKSWTGTGTMADVTPYVPGAGEPTNGFDNVTGYKYLGLYKNRLFVAGADANPNMVWFSEVGRYDYFPTGVTNAGDYWFNVNVGDGDRITAFGHFPDALIIFKEHSIWALIGDTPLSTSAAAYQLKPVNDALGTFSQETVVSTQGNLIFRGAEGVYGLTGLKFDYIGFKSMSAAINPNIIAVSANRETECAVSFQNKYWLAVEDNTRETYLMDYSMSALPWTRYSLKPTAFCVTQDRELLFGDSDGYVYKFGGVNSDDGTAITMYWEGKADAFGAPERMKKWKKFWLQFYTYGRVSPVTIEQDIDAYGFKNPVTAVCTFSMWGSETWGASKWGGSQSQTVRVSTWSPQQGRHMKLRISHDELDAKCSIHSIMLWFFYKNAR